ncbi:ribokinase [Paenibacillus nanensis]|uniref:Ribokinase n=1 Tax=Paenibacillus nanensis TaxID=393251 RepID=A0A3A1USV4_9BACL|nr:ribokinase [Paenibacillus nanensis]RIX51567.1 ribokinase [Paenibacillus nanensis]
MKRPKIAVIGSMNMDIVVKASRFPAGGETIQGDEIHFIPGGKGANQAVALARLGADVSMIGAVGLDSFGRTLLAAMADSGVNGDYIKMTERAPTGTASITLTPEDNSIVIVQGANAELRNEDIRAAEPVIAAADAVLLQLEIPLAAVEYAVKLASKHGKRIVLNPAPARELPEELLRRVHYITPNRTELELLTGAAPSGGLEGRSLEESVDALLAKGCGCVVTTLGAEGAAWKKKDGGLMRQAAHRMEVADTTGAGDAFNAGLAYGICAGYDTAESVAFAAKVSALAVTKFGAQDGMPTMSEVEAYFNRR